MTRIQTGNARRRRKQDRARDASALLERFIQDGTLGRAVRSYTARMLASIDCLRGATILSCEFVAEVRAFGRTVGRLTYATPTGLMRIDPVSGRTMMIGDLCSKTKESEG